MKMRYAAVLAAGMAILWAGGCQEEQASSDVKQSRLAAVENRELKTQCQQETKKRDEEIKNLNMQMRTETKTRDEEIKNLKSQMQKRDEEIKNLNTQMQTETKRRDDKIRSLETEKEKLNADVDNFAKQLAECVQEKQVLADKAEQDIKNLRVEYGEEIITPILNEKEGLETENARLKAELSKCEGKK